MKKTIPINTMPDGTCRTLKSQYFKNRVANFLHNGTWGATCVAVYDSGVGVEVKPEWSGV